ncbi:MAG: hypothetical protein CMP10_19790, partial [Zetaproteobacteria bacterium]|nr:hypothetical protein [Pseudobdellovibrionaceae bacterium]
MFKKTQFYFCLFIVSIGFLLSEQVKADTKAELEAQERNLKTDINALTAQQNNLNNSINAKKDQVDKLSTQEAGLRKTLSSVMTKKNKANADLAVKDNEYSDITNQIKAANDQKLASESLKQSLVNELEAVKEENVALSVEIASLAKGNEANEANLASKQNRLQSISSSNDRIRSQLNEQSQIRSELTKLRKIVQDDLSSLIDMSMLEETIGVLRSSKGSCNAFRIGVNTIRTAAHCVNDTNRFKKSRVKFVSLSGTIQAVTSVTKVNLAKDYVELSLDSSHTSNEVLTPTVPAVGQKLIFLYINSEEELVVSDSCSIADINTEDGYLFHNCDSVEGSSGGILITSKHIAGMHIGRTAEGLGMALTVPPSDLVSEKFGQYLDQLDFEISCGDSCKKKFLGQKIKDPVCEAARVAACKADELAKHLQAAIDRLSK